MKKIIFFLILLIYNYNIYGQGCSDAGICSITSTLVKNDTIKNTIQFLQTAGAGAEDVNYLSSSIGYTRFFSDKINVSLRINFISSSGSLGTISGIGDLFLTQTIHLMLKNVVAGVFY